MSKKLAPWIYSVAVGCMLSNALPTRAQAPDGNTDAPAVVREGSASRLLLPGGTEIRRTVAAVQRVRQFQVAESPTIVTTWEEIDATGVVQPYFAISLDGQRVSEVRAAHHELQWRHGKFDPIQVQDPLAAMLPLPEDNRLFVVQFVTVPLEVYRASLAALGVTVRQYVPDQAFIVEMSAEAGAQVAALPFVRAIEPYAVAYRLDAELRALLLNRAGDAQPRRYAIRLIEKNDARKEALAGRIVALGGTIEVLSPGGFMMEASLTPDQLAAVAALNDVEFIGAWSPPQTRMNIVRSTGGANYIESVAGYTGTGVRGEVMDDGCQSSHPDFAGRILIRGDAITTLSHGTATFGIVFGSGAGSSTARGMLPGAIGYFNDWDLQTSRYNDVGQLVQSPYQCVFQSNSWGHQDTTEYTGYTAELDDAVFDFDIVVLHSQGNSGTQAGVEHAWGKNVVGVGGIWHSNSSTLGDDVWAGTGSIGPAADGRIKPDLCFWYDNIRTTDTGSSYQSSFGGTSAACPMTAGHFGLFFQMWKDGLFGNPVSGGTVFQERAHSATARAMMINTAAQYTFSGAGHDLTRMHQGWGRPDVARLYDWRNNIFVVNETDVLAQFQTRRYSTVITPALPRNNELKVTLTYTDPPGVTNAGQHRVNDMTLKVTSPGGTIYYGNNGLLSGNWSTSGGAPDTINTVENVFIQSPAAGTWTIEVTAADINIDGHVQTGAMDMDYALVVSGGVTGSDCNGNAVEDDCDLDCELPGCNVAGCGQSLDCNVNGYPDECDIEDGITQDCNSDVVPDECQLAGNDCNNDLVPDDCQLAGNDCNGNSEPDDCDEAALAATITSPANQSPCPDGSASFTVSAPGATGYQWFRNGSEQLSNGGNVSGATGPTLTIDPATPADEGTYSSVVSVGCLSASSSSATLDLATIGVQVTLVTASPQDVCGAGGSVATFDVSVNDPSGVTYQWSHDGDDLVNGGRVSGANSAHLQITDVNAADAGFYTCTVENACTAEPDTATGELRVVATFAQQPPPSVCAEYGTDALISAQLGSPPPTTIRWYEGLTPLNNGSKFAGVTTTTLTVKNIQASDHGRQFRLRATVSVPTCTNYSTNAVIEAVPVGGCPGCATYGDMDHDGDYDLFDLFGFTQCFGADVTVDTACICANINDVNNVVDLNDWTALEALLSGPN